MKQIYLITEYGLEWELVTHAFLDENKCDEMITQLKEHVSKMESYRNLWENIVQKLNRIKHPEYDEFFNTWDRQNKIPEEYENYLYSDSFERFEYWMKKCFLDDYNQLSKELWEQLYQYYQIESKYYDDSTNYYKSSVKIYDA